MTCERVSIIFSDREERERERERRGGGVYDLWIYLVAGKIGEKTKKINQRGSVVCVRV